MMKILALAALAATPNSGVEFNLGDVDLGSIKFIQAYTYCFEQAAIATKGAAQDLRASRFEACHAQRASLVAQYSGDAGPSAVRKLERSLNIIDDAYAKGMGVALPEKE